MQGINNYMAFGIIQSKWIVANYIHRYMLNDQDIGVVKVKRKLNNI